RVAFLNMSSIFVLQCSLDEQDRHHKSDAQTHENARQLPSGRGRADPTANEVTRNRTERNLKSEGADEGERTPWIVLFGFLYHHVYLCRPSYILAKSKKVCQSEEIQKLCEQQSQKSHNIGTFEDFPTIQSNCM